MGKEDCPLLFSLTAELPYSFPAELFIPEGVGDRNKREKARGRKSEPLEKGTPEDRKLKIDPQSSILDLPEHTGV
jgi:hypothetical protein